MQSPPHLTQLDPNCRLSPASCRAGLPSAAQSPATYLTYLILDLPWTCNRRPRYLQLHSRKPYLYPAVRTFYCIEREEETERLHRLGASVRAGTVTGPEPHFETTQPGRTKLSSAGEGSLLERAYTNDRDK